MRNRPRLAVLGCAAFLLAASTLNGSEPLRMRVSPELMLAPGLVTVRASVEADSQNRFLEVVAESEDFYRSSQVQLNGKDAPVLNVVEFRNLPTGMYHITGVLVGEHGPRATVLKVAKVAASVGSIR
jgi:hypothetical protein